MRHVKRDAIDVLLAWAIGVAALLVLLAAVTL